MQTKLFRRDFTLVVIGQIISLFGNAILRFALPLYLLRETGSSTLFGVVTACSFAPMVILSMVGGVLADRVNKRNIMVGLDFSTVAIIMLFYFSLGKIPTVPLFIIVLMSALWYFRHIPAGSTGKRSTSGGERKTDCRKCGSQSG
ncbi:MFS transporter [Enterococcus cecorum]